MRNATFVAGITIAVSALDAGAQGTPNLPLSPDHQIVAAILPLPAEFRSSARVMGYSPDGKLTTLRGGEGAFTCLASDPRAQRFHVACYHRSLEPFMARGRQLRSEGTAAERVDSVRFREVKRGRLAMPKHPAALYSLTGPLTAFDTTTGTTTGARPLFVIYVPGATGASTGLSEKPAEGTPWIMFPGTPKAHVMFVPKM